MVGFFQQSSKGELQLQSSFIKSLTALGYPSLVVFLSFPCYVSESERHIIFTPLSLTSTVRKSTFGPFKKGILETHAFANSSFLGMLT